MNQFIAPNNRENTSPLAPVVDPGTTIILVSKQRSSGASPLVANGLSTMRGLIEGKACGGVACNDVTLKVGVGHWL